MNQARRSVRFERKPSQRYSRRANFEMPQRDTDRDNNIIATAVAAATSADNKKYLMSFMFISQVFVVLYLNHT